MKWFPEILLGVIFLVSCTQSDGATQATPSITVSIKTQTLLPTNTNIPTWTPTVAAAPSLTSTLTPIPEKNILFQRDFEDVSVGVWSNMGGIWNIEQEPDGNHCLLGYDPSSNNYPQLSYEPYTTYDWTDYAVETRFKFVSGDTLYMFFRDEAGFNEHYAIGVNKDGLTLWRTWTLIDETSMKIDLDKWHTFKVEIKGDTLKAYFDNLLFKELTLLPPVIARGGIAYVIGKGEKICLDDIKVWSLE